MERFKILFADCPDPCSLDDFAALLKQYEIDDWEAECGNNIPTQTTTSNGSVSRGMW